VASKKGRAASSGPATYTTLIPQHSVQRMVNVVDGQPFHVLLSRSNSQTDFARFKIAPGDTLIALHVDAGRVCPIARMRVSFKGTVGTWNAAHPQEPIAGHAATQVLVGDEGTPMHFARALPVELLRALRYDGKAGPRALKLHDDGRLKLAIGVDGVFRLMPESADELLSLAWL
jgi:hypothetical protein